MPKVSDLFEVRYGQSLELNRLTRVERPMGINFVSRAMTNNGVTARVAVDPTWALGVAGEMSVALGGNGVLSTFLQPEPFVCGRDVAILSSKDPNMSTVEKLWWARCILANKYRYSYGRQANRTLGSIMLPSNVPDWVTEATSSSFQWLNQSVAPIPPGVVAIPNEPTLRLDQIFHVSYGNKFDLNKMRISSAGVAFVGRKGRDQGVSARVEELPDVRPYEPGLLTVALGGAALATYVQQLPFYTAQNIAVLQPIAEMPLIERLFYSMCIQANAYRYTAFGREANRTLASVPLPAVVPEWVKQSAVQGIARAVAIHS